jgi:DNA-binding beta-propeller fold protein YncE
MKRHNVVFSGRGTLVILICAVAVGLVGANARASAKANTASRGTFAGRWSGGGIPGRLSSILGRSMVVSRGSPPSHAAGPAGPGGTTVAVGANPTGVAVNPVTHTVYVGNGNDSTVSVINASTCSAVRRTGCSQTPPTISVGSGPGLVAVNAVTDTVYVGNLFGNTVSVINGAECNAMNTFGCGQAPATIQVGSGPGIPGIDPSTNTIYVPNSNDGTVSVINGATCDAQNTSGCSQTPPTVAAGSGAGAVAVDPRTHTVYVTNFNDGTVSVINGATCNATNASGCGQAPATVPVGPLPVDVLIDQASQTVYVPVSGPSLGALDMIDASACNATNTSGCNQAPSSTPIGSAPIWIDEDASTHTVYVANQEDSSVSVIDASSCNATNASGCQPIAPALASGFDMGGVGVDPTTHTVYGSSQNNNTISVLDGARCNATTISSCTTYAAVTTIGNGPQPVGVDASTGTVYVGNIAENTVSVIDAGACNAADRGGCGQAWPTVTVDGSAFFGVAVDGRTDTVYVSNAFTSTGLGTTVSMIDAATCNAHDSSGCAGAPPDVTVGNCPAGIAINDLTRTVYVANLCDNTISVFSEATCNAQTTSGCSNVATVNVGNGPITVGINETTDTVYVGNNGDNTVSVINGAVCNATNTSGCGEPPATVQIQDSPFSLAVDAGTNTVYVANAGDEIFATGYANQTSTVSMIDGANCNGSNPSGCSQAPLAFAVGGFPWGVAVDPRSHNVYVTSIVDSTLAVVNGNACNGHNASGCQAKVLRQSTGGWPNYIGLEPGINTVYVPNNVDGTVSVFTPRP